MQQGVPTVGNGGVLGVVGLDFSQNVSISINWGV